MGFQHQIVNPLSTKSKGQVVSGCLNQNLVSTLSAQSASCAKRGHKRWWIRRNALGCGRCMPCIYRRAALNTVGLDVEEYGFDICRGEVDPRDSGDGSMDFRACLTFLNRRFGLEQIAEMLLRNGPACIGNLRDNALIIATAMDEIRNLIQQKGTPQVKQWAGLRD